MSGQDALRPFYPRILTLQPNEAHRLARGDRFTEVLLLEACDDLQKVAAIPHVFGCTAMGITRYEFYSRYLTTPDKMVEHYYAFSDGDDFEDLADHQFRANFLGSAWFGIGHWVLAERYYFQAVRLALSMCDMISTLQNGTNLAMTYLGAGAGDDAATVAKHLLEVADMTVCKGIYYVENYVGPEAATALRLGLLMCGQTESVAAETERIQQIRPDWADYTESIFDMVASAYRATGDKEHLRHWEQLWKDAAGYAPSQQATGTAHEQPSRRKWQFWKRDR